MTLKFLPFTKKVWGKVIFSEICVKNSVHRGGRACSGWGVTAPGGVCCQGVPVPGGSLLPERWVPAPGGSAPVWGLLPQGACSRGCGDPPMMATAAGHIHPTGMHSC